MTHENIEKTKSRGIYLLPNLFTAAGLFAGFYAIVAALKGFFDLSAIAIFIAMIMDGLDGRVARLTNTQSDFGVEFDSLADVVSFGVAPALVLYSWSLSNLGKIGWLASFLFAACGALRLARFNTQVSSADKGYFQGLPIPGAAAVVASLVWVGYDYTNQAMWFEILVLCVTVTAALLMVSNIRFHSFKNISFRDKVPFIGIFIVFIAFICIALNPPAMLFIVFVSYAISGPILTLHAIGKKRRLRILATKRREQKRQTS
jgi:CDP-diacylglycerol---serine O-phosphatidyltransferase